MARLGGGLNLSSFRPRWLAKDIVAGVVLGVHMLRTQADVGDSRGSRPAAGR